MREPGKYKPLKKLEEIKTVKMAIKCHKHMWSWIVEHNPMCKPIVSGLEKYNNCYLCYISDTKCSKCPMETKCWQLDSLYLEWKRAVKSNNKKASKIAAENMANQFD